MAAWIYIVEWISRLILLILVGLSVWAVKIILERKKFFDQLEAVDQSADSLEKMISSSKKEELKQQLNSKKGIRVQALQSTLSQSGSEAMERAMAGFLTLQKKVLETGLPILGTLGSTTPFIGLLGTIMGIIVAFGALSSGQLDSQKVMYALAEALILTAVGLAVAIPSVIANNYFNRRLLSVLRDCDALKDLSIARFSKEP
ncbi:MAG: MotA/TolQ/ExbB proton channel family protein [Pseudobdellovibrionaceae bacterium]